MFNILNVKKELEAANLDRANLVQSLKDKGTELEGALSRIQSLSDEVAAVKAELEQVKAQAAAQTQVVKAETDRLEEKANAKAAEIVANIGVPQTAIPTAKQDLITDAEILAKFNTLSGVEQTNFYNQYSRQILRAAGLKK
jgi:DNA-binding transcriptional MerR regulator